MLCCSWFLGFFAVTLVEFLNSSAGSDITLLAGVERVTLGAELDVELWLGRAGREGLATRAGDLGLDVIRVDTGAHCRTSIDMPLVSDQERGQPANHSTRPARRQ